MSYRASVYMRDANGDYTVPVYSQLLATYG